MKKFLTILGLTTLFVFTSCNKDDDKGGVVATKPYDEVYATDIENIEAFLRTHSLDVELNANNDVVNVSFDTITNNSAVSIMDQTQYPLQHKIVKKHDIEYKLYYIKLDSKTDTDADGIKPSGADKVFASYKGMYLNKEVFEVNTNGINFDLTGVIASWQLIIPEFRSGSNQLNTDGTYAFENYGSGIVFSPSGLAYYNNSSNVKAYSSLIFTFNLHQVYFLDHDNDGILSRNEFGYNTDGTIIDTDGDGIPDYIDSDDDNDGYLTKEEIKVNGVTPAFDDILNCQGTTGGLKKHLDSTCH